MLSHVVIFRTRRKENVDALYECVKKLENIDLVKSFHCGKPVPSARPVVDDFFDVAAVIGLEDEAALDAYAKHPIHQDFVENCLKKLEVKVLVYDIKD